MKRRNHRDTVLQLMQQWALTSRYYPHSAEVLALIHIAQQASRSLEFAGTNGPDIELRKAFEQLQELPL